LPGVGQETKYAQRELRQLALPCRWTEDVREGLDGLRWNEVQEDPRHPQVLSNYFIRN
jgi:hypothetical protein